MSARYVPVPAAAIRERLAAAGFRLLLADASYGEEVYVRSHDRDARYIIKVYSSIRRGTEEVRECGQDAIRVVAVVEDGRHHWPAREIPIFKAVRVYRTGSVDKVLDRMIERAREAYGACNDHRNGKMTP